MEGKVQLCSSPWPSAAVISAVLGDDDLLHEIILRLSFPVNLVCAALVCKRWYRVASHPAFLRRFRELHPPCLLGFYVNTKWAMVGTSWWKRSPIGPQFIPMLPKSQELAAVVRRASFGVENYVNEMVVYADITDCRNGSVFTRFYRGHEYYPCRVHAPLFPERGMIIVPPPPNGTEYVEYDTYQTSYAFFSREGINGLSYLWLEMDLNRSGKASARVSILQDGVWCIHTSATTQLPGEPPSSTSILVDDKIYTAITVSSILVLDLMASSFFTIELPEGVRYGDGAIELSPADNSGVYLIHVKGLQLGLWFHRGGNGITENWLLMDTVCLQAMCALLTTSSNKMEDDSSITVKIAAAGDNAEFVFLEVGQCAFYLDMKSRGLRKVYEVVDMDQRLAHICPFKMIWPPSFHALKVRLMQHCNSSAAKDLA